MRGFRLWQGCAAAAALCTMATHLSAAPISATGVFTTDDQVASISFSLSAPATVTALTWSYAGGVNQAGTIIPQGGFDPWLAIFDAGGNLRASVDNGTCGQVPTDSVTGSCFDSYISQSLGAGTYTLVVSQSDNQPVGSHLSDGYFWTGQPTFTSVYACSNGQFCDANGNNRTGDWAVDILDVGAASVPEPGTLALVGVGLGSVCWMRRRKD